MSGPTNPTEAYFDKGLWGHDGTQWRRLNLLWGYYDRWTVRVAVSSTGAENTSAFTTAVPAGYVYVAQSVFAYHSDATARLTLLRLDDNDKRPILEMTPSLAQYTGITAKQAITLKEGDQLECRITYLTPGKSLEISVAGYKMRINLG